MKTLLRMTLVALIAVPALASPKTLSGSPASEIWCYTCQYDFFGGYCDNSRRVSGGYDSCVTEYLADDEGNYYGSQCDTPASAKCGLAYTFDALHGAARVPVHLASHMFRPQPGNERVIRDCAGAIVAQTFTKQQIADTQAQLMSFSL
jgi:hypothetical protein